MKTLALLCAACLCGCAPDRAFVDVPSRNQNGRVNYLVIHFTTENFADSLALLTEASDNPVSSHYLIPEPDDPTYPRSRLRIYRLVDESRRAWHAGVSSWNGEESLNNRSIGIELVNRSYCTDDTEDGIIDIDAACVFPEFADAQIELLVALVEEILARHPEIDPIDVVAHADIAPHRKVDPGPRFPWRKLHRAGIGAWYDDDTVLEYRRRFAAAPPSTRTVQLALAAYGYGIDATGELDPASRRVLRAFQMHFLPSSVTGEVDLDTSAALFALIDKYRPERLEELLEHAALPELEPAAQ